MPPPFWGKQHNSGNTIEPGGAARQSDRMPQTQKEEVGGRAALWTANRVSTRAPLKELKALGFTEVEGRFRQVIHAKTTREKSGRVQEGRAA